MVAGIVADSSRVRAKLAEVCARNVPAEIHYGAVQNELKTARVRFLALEESALCTDKPQNVESGVDLRRGQRVSVFFSLGKTRWAFESRVQKVTRLVRLNSRQRVVGMALRVPAELKIQQRRREYRVSVASAGIACTVAPESAWYANACDLDCTPLAGTICNICAGGIAVVIEGERKERFPFGTRLFLAFGLPDGGEEFLMLGQVRHAKEVRGRENTVIGVRFLPMPVSDHQAQSRRVARFVAHEQRRKLRRRR